MATFVAAPARGDQTPEFWQSQNIYQVITDRFYDGDPANNNAEGNYNPAGSSGTSVHGGDFKGLEQKLDYIKSLGATAIWVSPVVLNANGEFHGYAGRDFYQVAPHWGTLTDLQHFTAAAHARVRQDIAHLEHDRLMYPDLDRGAELVRSGEIVRAVEEALGAPLE